jgi:hypothetical protein
VGPLDPCLETIRSFWLQFLDIGPRIVIAFVPLTVGWSIARLIRKGTIRTLKLVRLDHFAELTGVEGFLSHGGREPDSRPSVVFSYTGWCLQS